MELSGLSNELLLLIAEEFQKTSDLNSFLQTNHHLTDLLTPLLNKALFKEKDKNLHWAVRNGRESLIRLLLDNGANINFSGHPDYTTPLMEAALNMHTDIVKLLLEKGADVTVKGEFFSTAIEYAVAKDCMPIVLLLLDAGAPLETTHNKWRGGNLFSQVVKKGNVALIQHFLDRGVRPIDLDFCFTVRRRQRNWISIAKVLLDGGLGISKRCMGVLEAFDVTEEDNREDIITKITSRPRIIAKEDTRVSGWAS